MFNENISSDIVLTRLDQSTSEMILMEKIDIHRVWIWQ